MDRSTFETTYTGSSSPAVFADNSTRQITEASMQQFAQDISDTFATISDDLVNVSVRQINIGDWDMDATATVTVDLGYTGQTGKIRVAGVVLRADSLTGNNNAYILPFIDSSGNIDAWYNVLDQNVSSFTLKLYRRAAGTFDSTTFNQTSYNRGWITIIETA